VDSGLLGMIIIEDPTDCSVPKHIQKVSCPSNCEHDIQLLFQSNLFYSVFGFADVQMLMKDNLSRCKLRSLLFLCFLFCLTTLRSPQTLLLQNE